MDEDISPEELANALAELAPKLAEEAMVVNDPQLQKIVKSIAPNIKSIESTLKEGVAFKSASFAAVFQPLVNVFTKPIFDIRKTLSNSITSLTDKITKPFKDVRNFLNKPIFNIKDTFKKAFGGVRNLFGFKTKEQKEEAERNNPARAIIRYMKKRIEPLLKRIAGIRVGDDDDGLFSMLKNLLNTLGLGTLGSAIGTLGTAAAALTTAVTSFAVGTTFFENVISPMMDRLFQRNLELMNKTARNPYVPLTNNDGQQIGLTPEGTITTDLTAPGVSPLGIPEISGQAGSGFSPKIRDAPEGARLAPARGEISQEFGLDKVFSQYITPLDILESRIYSQALDVKSLFGSRDEKRKSQTVLAALLNEYAAKIKDLASDRGIIEAMGVERHKALMESITSTPFYKSLLTVSQGMFDESGIGTTDYRNLIFGVKTFTKTPMAAGVESIPGIAEIFARQDVTQEAQNQIALQNLGPVQSAPVIVQSNPTSITNPTENFFSSGLSPELSPLERMIYEPLPAGFGVLQPQ
tara:strand:+ start:198 stop:1766 length:1569 start_codon:yes stop_codon:yes gene_type:complete